MADLVGEVGGRALLDQLLMASLARAVALAEPERVAVRVGQDLHLDVSRPCQVALHVALVATEVGERLTLGRLEGLGSLVGRVYDLHASATTTECRLDRHWPAELLAKGDDFIGGTQRLGPTGDTRDTGGLSGQPGTDLVAHDLDRLRRWADEGDALGRDGPGEIGVFREEAVTWVDGIGPGLLDGGEDGFGIQIALGSRLSTKGICLVGESDVEGVPVKLGVHSDGGDAHLPAGSDHPDGNLSTVRDQDLLQHA